MSDTDRDVLTKREEERLAAEARAKFAERLGIARVAAGFTDQDQAGAVLRLGKRRWGGYEGGRREPPLWFLRKLPEMFHRPLSWFFDLPDERGLSDKEAQIISLLRQLDDPIIRESALDGTINQLEHQVALQETLRGRQERSASR